MALPATETFTAANGTGIGSLTGWSDNAGGLEVQGNAAVTNADAENSARYSGETFPNDQYAEATFTTPGGISGQYIGLAVRMDTGGATTYYGSYWNDTVGYLFKQVSGSWTQLGSLLGFPGSGTVVRLEAEGTTVRVLYDGVEEASVTDSDISSGAAGLCGYGTSSSPFNALDDWEGGSLSGGDTTAPTLSSATASATGATTASGSVTTNEAGTADAVLTTSATAPTAVQVQAGQDHTGAAAVATDLNVAASVGSVAFSYSGITAGATGLYQHCVVEDAAANVSSVATAGPFSLAAFVPESEAVVASEDETGAGAASVTVAASAAAVEDESFAEPPDTTIYITGTVDASEDESAALPSSVLYHATVAAEEDETLAVSATSTPPGGPTQVFSEPVGATTDETGAATLSVLVAATAPAVTDEAATASATATVYATVAAAEDEVLAVTAIATGGEIDLSPPFTASWTDPARTASWTDPARTAEWSDG